MNTSTYNITIKGGVNGETFSGSFVVNNMNGNIIEFYQDGNPSSILIPISVGKTTGINNDFQYTDPNTKELYSFTTVTDGDFITPYSNVYLPSWKSFPYNGVLIKPTNWHSSNGSKILLSKLQHDQDLLIMTNEGIIYVGDYRTVIDVEYTITPQLQCFNDNTKILCLNNNLKEVYLPIKDLKKGSMVKTFKHGYRKIDSIGKGSFRNHPDKWDNCMYVLPKNMNMIDDLILTGGHSILVDNLTEYETEEQKKYWPDQEIPKIDNKFLLLAAVSNKFNKVQNENQFTFYHFCLENDGNNKRRFGVWANGILVETPSKLEYMKHRYSS
jgi:hypothetical protein